MPETTWDLINKSIDNPNDKGLFKKAYESTHKSSRLSMAQDDLKRHKNYDKFIKLLK